MVNANGVVQFIFYPPSIPTLGFVGVKNVSVSAPCKLESFSTIVIIGIGDCGSLDAIGITRSGGASKNSEGLAGGVVLAGIDIDDQLDLALLQRNQRRERQDNHRR